MLVIYFYPYWWDIFKKENDRIWDLALLLGPLQDPLLNGALADEAIDGDLLGLTQSVSPVHGLLVHRRVPVAVIEDNLEEESEREKRHINIKTQVIFF